MDWESRATLRTSSQPTLATHGQIELTRDASNVCCHVSCNLKGLTRTICTAVCTSTCSSRTVLGTYIHVNVDVSSTTVQSKVGTKESRRTSHNANSKPAIVHGELCNPVQSVVQEFNQSTVLFITHVTCCRRGACPVIASPRCTSMHKRRLQSHKQASLILPHSYSLCGETFARQGGRASRR